MMGSMRKVAKLKCLAREGFTKEVIYEQRTKHVEGVSHVGYLQ